MKNLHMANCIIAYICLFLSGCNSPINESDKYYDISMSLVVNGESVRDERVFIPINATIKKEWDVIVNPKGNINVYNRSGVKLYEVPSEKDSESKSFGLGTSYELEPLGLYDDYLQIKLSYTYMNINAFPVDDSGTVYMQLGQRNNNEKTYPEESSIAICFPKLELKKGKATILNSPTSENDKHSFSLNITYNGICSDDNNE